MPLRADSKEVNQQTTVFECFSPSSMSDDEEDVESWEETGAFPKSSPSNSNNHIFTDEPFDGGYYSSLEIVREGSKETMTGNTPGTSREDFRAAISTASSDTPATDNTADAAMLKKKALHQKQKQQQMSQLSTRSTTSSGSSAGVYPFNIYQSLSRLEEKKKREQQPQQSDTGVEQPANRSFVSSASSRGGIAKRMDIESGGSMPSPTTPMSLGEESSVISDQQSQIMEAVSVQAPYSVVSARSRRQSRKCMVRHTLSSSQQVNAHPATMLKNLFIGIEAERHMHQLAGQNLRAVHNWFLFLPTILLTLLSGVTALVFEADLNATADAQVYASIFVGVTALISVFWQAMSKMLDLGTRGTLHDVTSGALKRLSEDILLTLSSTESIPAEYVALIAEKFSQALDACPSSVPYKLESAFSAVSDRMVLMLKPPMGQPPRKYVHKLDFMRLYATAYDELTTEIIHYWLWPFAFPQPRSASEAALRNFKAIVTEGREAAEKTKGCLRILCPCVGTVAVERGLFDVIPTASIADTNATSNSQPHNNNYPIRNHATLGEEI